jgi:hypothetical protein
MRFFETARERSFLTARALSAGDLVVHDQWLAGGLIWNLTNLSKEVFWR